ncbi:hypothetical protein NG798_27590 [Ancylothrix sp. C2]|nr:hypothetical protein [Ancylothrix sp. D3o]MCT7953564.1 hypothetical protein [Ancylothrix sp. D3o]
MSSQQILGIATPASEIEIDGSLVHSLLTSQHPDNRTFTTPPSRCRLG